MRQAIDGWSGLETARSPSIRARCGALSFELTGHEPGSAWGLTLELGSQTSGLTINGQLEMSHFQQASQGFATALRENADLVRYCFGGARLLRLDPDALRQASSLIPDSDRVRLQSERGGGLPGVYDAILNRGDESFRRVVDEVRGLFPTVRNVRLRVVSESAKALEVELNSGERVPAQFISEGLLYYLAFAAIRYLEPVSILLVEEPENGLHPARIEEVMRTLREISKTTQVLIATHSPLVVNELSGDEVSVVTRDPDRGTQVRRLSSTPNFEERSKVYATGELWLSYANGSDEGPLLSHVSR